MRYGMIPNQVFEKFAASWIWGLFKSQKGFKWLKK